MIFIDVNKCPKEKYLIDKPTHYVLFLYNYSGLLEVKIASKSAHVSIFGLFIGKNKDDFKLRTIQHHSEGQNFSNLLIKGVFFDESRFIYEGLIRIDKNSQKTHAYQKNQNLIIGKNSFVDSRPFLEILANDVFCTHGSTTGQLNKGQLYYLETRGLPQKKAQQLLIEGFVNDLFGKIEELGYRQKLSYVKNQIVSLCLND